MANAGRILIMPKGNYDANATYEMIDLVSHKGTSWLAKKTVKGIEPSAEHSEYWQHMFNVSAEDVDEVKQSINTLESEKISVEYTVHSDTEDYFCESYKYSDGRMVINMMYKASVNFDRESGTLSYGEVQAKEFPISFIRKPAVTYTCEGGGTNAFIWGKDEATKDATAPLYIARGTIAPEPRVMKLVAKADGRWK